MSYPTGDDLHAFLVQAGMIKANASDSLDYSGYMDAAIQQWEQDSYYQPFLFSGSESQRTYDCPDGFFLDIQAGLMSASSVTLDGRVLVAGLDFDLFPYNAPAKGKPYTAVRFRYFLKHYAFFNADIKVTGNWGYCSTLPADVKQALLSLAASNLMGSTAFVTGFVNQIKQDDITIGYATSGSNALLSIQQNQLMSFYDKTLKRYRRTRLF